MKGWLAIALLLVGTAAHAEDVPPPKDPPKPVPASVRLSHHKQFGVSLRFVEGLRAIAPYDDEFCGSTDAQNGNQFSAVCTGRSPFAVDLELGYGIAQKVDLFLELRLGLEADFGSSPSDVDGTRQFHISPGARFFFADAGSSKLFTTAQVVFDASGYQDVAGGKLGTDFGLRNMNGLWFDIERSFGVYVFVGETLSFSRWLRFELEAGVGAQVRIR